MTNSRIPIKVTPDSFDSSRLPFLPPWDFDWYDETSVHEIADELKEEIGKQDVAERNGMHLNASDWRR